MISIISKTGVVNILIALISISFVIPPQIINPILIGVLFVFVIIRFLANRNYFFYENFNKASILFIIYFLLLLISLTYSDNISKGLDVVGQSVGFAIIPIIPLFVSKKEINWIFITKCYIYFLCFVFFLLIFIAAYRNFEEGYNLHYIYNRLSGLEKPLDKYSYINHWYFVYDKFTDPLKIQPIYMGLFANIGVCFLLFLKKNNAVRYFYVQLIVLILLTVLSASRWQILICVINTLIFLVFFQTIQPLKKILGGVGLIFGVLIISWLNPITKTRLLESFSYKEAFYKDKFGGTSIRLKKWESSIHCIKESPLFGFGVGDAKAKLLQQFKNDKFYSGFYHKYNSHNQYLDTLLLIGIIGVIVLLSLFLVAYKYSFYNLQLLLIINIFSIGFITESMLNRQWGILSFCFFINFLSVFKYAEE